MSWCELVDAMRERRLEWDGRRPWDPEGRFVALEAQPAEDEPPPCTVDQALRLLPPWQPEQADHVR
jgi:hypothetical protein